MANLVVLFTAVFAVCEYVNWKESVNFNRKIKLLEKVVSAFNKLEIVLKKLFNPLIVKLWITPENQKAQDNPLNDQKIDIFVTGSQVMYKNQNHDAYDEFLKHKPLFVHYFPKNSRLYDDVERLWESINDANCIIPEYLDPTGTDNTLFRNSIRDIISGQFDNYTEEDDKALLKAKVASILNPKNKAIEQINRLKDNLNDLFNSFSN